MSLNVEKELPALRRMTVGELRARYAEVFGEPTNGRHKDWLVKRIIWRMQAVSEGDLTERARRRAEELANDADLRCRPPKAPPAAPEPAQTSTGPQAAGFTSSCAARQQPRRAIRRGQYAASSHTRPPCAKRESADGPSALGGT